MIKELSQKLDLTSNWWIYISFFAIIMIFMTIIISAKKIKNDGSINKKKDYNMPTKYFNKDTEITLNDLLELDKDYNEKAYLLSLYKSFVNIQNDYMNMNILGLKNKVSQRLYDIYSDNLAKFKIEGRKHMITDINPVKSKIISIKIEDNKEIVNLYLEVTCFDYILSVNSSSVVLGSKTSSINLGMELTFSRDITNEINNSNCNHCGNILPSNTSGTCPFCGALVLSNEYNWVLEKRSEVLKTTL